MIRSYAITDPLYYGETPEALSSSIKRVLGQKRVDYLCFRDKITSHYESMAESFMLTCKALDFDKTLLHGDVELSHQLGAYGVHVSSKQFESIAKAKAYGLFCVASTHSEDEISLAIKLGADAVTYSPIFSTPNKGSPKGLEDLNEKVAKIKTKIIALGGIISDEQIADIESTGAYAFASIRYFVK
ncbi:MAG: thiamine phosphate synthase [Campylobacterota bacterium]|nr:thiamine phosphate synthase [Campylobacterota bacterium]